MFAVSNGIVNNLKCKQLNIFLYLLTTQPPGSHRDIYTTSKNHEQWILSRIQTLKLHILRIEK